MRLTSGTSSFNSASRFAASSGIKGGQPCKILTRVGEAHSKAEDDRITHVDHNDGDRCCRVVSRHSGWGRGGDQVWGDPDEVCGELGKAVLLALRPPVFDDYALPLDITEFAQTQPELLTIGPRRDGRTAREKADPVDLARLLRLDGERRGEEAAGHGSEERSTLH